MSLNDAYNFIEGNYNIDSQKGRELRYILDSYKLKPKVYIAYDRLAYQGVNDFRITLDFNVRYKTQNVRLENPNNTQKLLEDGYYLMEVKASNAYPTWIIEALSKYKIYPISFSKYGNIYKKLMSERMI